jgi:hypothetical protein
MVMMINFPVVVVPLKLAGIATFFTTWLLDSFFFSEDVTKFSNVFL